MKQYKISEEEVKALVAYLQKKPFEEVVQGVQMLTRLQEIEEEVKKEEKK